MHANATHCANAWTEPDSSVDICGISELYIHTPIPFRKTGDISCNSILIYANVPVNGDVFFNTYELSLFAIRGSQELQASFILRITETFNHESIFGKY